MARRRLSAECFVQYDRIYVNIKIQYTHMHIYRSITYIVYHEYADYLHTQIRYTGCICGEREGRSEERRRTQRIVFVMFQTKTNT